MPLSPDPFLTRFERLRKLRRRPWIGYSITLVAVGSSIGARAMLGDLLVNAPFLTFYPAIVLAALVGGFRAGVIAVIASAFAADYLFLKPPDAVTTPAELVALALFVVVAVIQVGLVVVLNTAVERLWRQADNFRFVIDAEPTGLIAMDQGGMVQLVNAAVEQQFGYPRGELFGQPVEVLVPDKVREGRAELRRKFLLSPEARPMGAGRDLQGRRKDGTTMPVEVGLNPIERGGKHGTLATVIDISERKAAERHQHILMSEIRHRGRNFLAIDQAIAARILTDGRTVHEARKEFLATIQALARTQELFLTTMAAPLARIIEGELAPFSDRVSIDLCEVSLTQSAAQDFALIVHELATNAVKYGALSGPEGTITVSGWQAGKHLIFLWEEHGGPTVEPPTRQGFGHTILNEVARGFCIHVAADYRPEGFRYELKAELGKISDVIELSPQLASETS